MTTPRRVKLSDDSVWEYDCTDVMKPWKHIGERSTTGTLPFVMRSVERRFPWEMKEECYPLTPSDLRKIADAMEPQ